ncbi:hypothetical protein COV42_00270 [Candidatus Campbellbacteria bacterium CG11_big_fil_rev_8_21_14_0_20_44_21]|uniref:Endolytic murein transglycosylase n=1 Tax=Candidatus Campbellbacteria bacterium CG22_combo_CG10-13_8_21_14_all_43_18 TaxID=1974530 RepID=A0A2H0DWQ2_9BACT|nr:MAG: hypothetical protein COW82_01120 [Candidatus Campbellbacteria bacterium CG22_combo_CG10-13_8_21_14_all_43_18]PIR24512.1 MAG: hypothetical protein COV42_00270 [Candidatus Campbellbacteria bacterium CG11_big_fil_rev_8_21_14_0_20_44_21]
MSQEKFFRNLEFLKKRNVLFKNIFLSSAVVFSAISLFYFGPPGNFPEEHIIGIKEGSSLDEIISVLKKENIIISPFWFKAFSYLSFKERNLVAGDYYFHEKESLLNVLTRLIRGEYGLFAESVTLPEGATASEMGKILKRKFSDFDEAVFVELSGEEGFLFPDTYKFLPNAKPAQVIDALKKNFEEKISEFGEEIKKSGKSLREIIIMASILEKEARTDESRKIISGILWKRIKVGMPLQVDAVFPYIIGKNTFELSLEDLEFDSLYNTYRNLGLPPGAISNPGLSSILAALRPETSPYFFYLSDREGKIHYAEDFEGHKRNKALYLR